MRGHGLETGKKLDNLGKADLTQAGVLMDVDGHARLARLQQPFNRVLKNETGERLRVRATLHGELVGVMV